jgi:AcrR family transcriptional regulator
MRRVSEIGRPKGANSVLTRARIVAAARVGFSRAGYAGTTLQDIAQLAQITQAAIYKYFDSKLELYMATVQEAKGALLPRYREALAGARSAREALQAVLTASGELHANDPSLASFLSALPVEMQRHPELAAAMADGGSDIVEIFESAVALGIKSGEIRREDAPLVVALFVACSMGLSLFAAAVVGSSLPDIVGVLNTLIDGDLFRKPKRVK